MAERRMFAKSIVLSDAFLDMPLTARCLYFTLGMVADDDGFVGSPKAIMRQCGASQDDMTILLQKRYILAFDSGVIVIKHWRMNNYLQNDRHKGTTYIEELEELTTDKKGAYTEKDKAVNTPCIQNVYTDKNSIDKYSLDKNSIGKYREGEYEGERDSEESLHTPKKPTKQKYGEYNHVRLTEDEFNRLCNDFGESTTLKAIKAVDEYCQQNGKTYKDYNLAIRRWGIRAANENKNEPASVSNSVEEMMRQAGLM